MRDPELMNADVQYNTTSNYSNGYMFAIYHWKARISDYEFV